MKKFKKKKKYYYDVIEINSYKTKKELISILPINELKKHCNTNKHGNIIVKANNTAKLHGYKCKLKATAVTDDFINIIKNINGIGNLTKIQVTKELIFKNNDDAERYRKIHNKKIYLKYSKNKEFTYYGDDGSYTTYKGKIKGERETNKILSTYVSKSKIDNNNNNNNDNDDNCLRVEFTIKEFTKINKKLNIINYHGLLPAKKAFKILSKKFIKIPKIKKAKLKKLFMIIYKDEEVVNNKIDCINNYDDLRNWFFEYYDLIKMKQQLNFLLKYLGIFKRLRSIEVDVINKKIKINDYFG